MDRSYSAHDSKPGFTLVVIAVILILAGVGGGYWYLNSRKIVSPLPPQPSFEVIFATPTLLPAEPTSTPSATPKVKKTPSATPKPKATLTPTPKPSVLTPTPKS